MAANKEIYIIVSQTGTILSRILKVITKAKYNHASISVDRSMKTMYSFGRLNPYNPVVGGFVKESPFFGTFKRFRKTKAVILSIPVTEEQHEALTVFLQYMYSHKRRYRYNYLGLLLALFSIAYKEKDCYYCSEFVRAMLDKFDIISENRFEKIVKPMSFLSLSEGKVIYSGSLKEYATKYFKALPSMQTT